MSKLLDFDKDIKSQGFNIIAGVDEAGRGPWAGPVVAASVILPAEISFEEDLKDSKLILPTKRKQLFELIKKEALAYTVYSANEKVIDKINILEATKLIFKNCILNLSIKPDIVLVDGISKIPDINIQQRCIIKGDNTSASIAAASILAKVTRDNIMEDLAKAYPLYEFAKHKGYGTKLHMEKIKLHGPCEIHRKSFKPIRNIISN